jgi:hypothetical protein
MSWADFFKSYAGPMATIVASLAAGYFARSQAATAAAQKEIAFDKLKHDLFDKRYEIYLAAVRVADVTSSVLSSFICFSCFRESREAARLRVSVRRILGADGALEFDEVLLDEIHRHVAEHVVRVVGVEVAGALNIGDDFHGAVGEVHSRTSSQEVQRRWQRLNKSFSAQRSALIGSRHCGVGRRRST